MALIILSLFICLFLLANKLCEKNSLKVIFINIYLLWWLVSLELSIDTKGYLNTVSSRTYWFFILNVISFALAYLLIDNKHCCEVFIKVKRKLFKNKQSKMVKKNEDFNIKNYQSGIFVWIVEIIILLILSYYLYRYNLLLNEYGIYKARIIRFELGYMLRKPIELLFYNYVIQATISIIAILIPIHIFNGKFKNPVIYLGLLIVFFNAQIGKGRMIIFELLLYFILTFIIYFHKRIWNYIRKYWILISLVIGISAISMVMLTLIRLKTDFGSTKSIMTNLSASFDQVILYFTGSIRAFDYSLVHNYRGQIISNYGKTLGGATFSGINEFFIMALRGFGMEILTINMKIGALTQPSIFIGETIQYNAFYSCILNYYIDFGVMGIVLFGGLFGGFISLLIKNILKTKDVYLIVILVLNLYIALFSTLRWEYQSPSTWMIILMILTIRTFHKMYLNKRNKNKV